MHVHFWFLVFLVWCGSVRGASSDPDELLSRIRQKMAANLTDLPNYTCRQTIDRMVRRGGPARPFQPLDSTRLEVAFLGGREIYARSGKEQFDEKDIRKLVPPGTIGNGNFAMHAKIVFASDTPVFTYVGEEKKRGHRAIRYNFQVPLEKSVFVVRNGDLNRHVAYKGSFWVDADTLDLIRLEVNVTDIPRELQLSNIRDVIEYQRTLIGKGEFLLPHRSELETQDLDGNAGHNYTKFDRCQEFVGTSIVRFGQEVPAE